MAVTQSAGDSQRVSVTWAYRYWLSLADEPNSPKPLEDRLAEIALNTVSKALFSNIPSVLRKLF